MSRRTQEMRPSRRNRFAYGAFTRSGRPSQDRSATVALSDWTGKPRRTPTTPRTRGHAVWAPPRSLAATGGISFDFYSRWYSDGSLPSVYRMRAIFFTRMRMSSGHSGYPIRKPADLRVLAPPRGLSQLIASFFAWQLLGILRGPLFT